MQTMTRAKKQYSPEKFLHADKINLSKPLPFPVNTYKWNPVPDLTDFLGGAIDIEYIASTHEYAHLHWNELIFETPVEATLNSNFQDEYIGTDEHGALYTE